VVATFCLRLAAGLLFMLPILSPAPIPPRFYRVHFLTALGLLVVAGFFIHEQATPGFWAAYGVACLGCLIGSIVWHLDEAPGGRIAVYLTPVALAACLIYGGILLREDGSTPVQMVAGNSLTPLVERSGSPLRTLDDLLGAFVLGSAMTAMLMGHSYLISPAMTIVPLIQLLAALGVSVLVRIGLAGFGLWEWTSHHGASNLETELLLWLPVRWGLGLIAPLVLGWMAWETARIRSTQSATGILYGVVIVCFLGELTSQLLVVKTGAIL
jgi:hypothetical protein